MCTITRTYCSLYCSPCDLGTEAISRSASQRFHHMDRAIGARCSRAPDNFKYHIQIRSSGPLYRALEACRFSQVLEALCIGEWCRAGSTCYSPLCLCVFYGVEQSVVLQAWGGASKASFVNSEFSQIAMNMVRATRKAHNLLASAHSLVGLCSAWLVWFF